MTAQSTRFMPYNLTGTPASRKADFTSPTRSSPKWKTLAASTASAPAVDRRREVLDRAGAAAGHQRDVDDGPHRRDQLQVEAGLGAVGVHRVEQDLAGPEPRRLRRPGDRVQPGRPPAAVRRHLEAARLVGAAPRVDRQHQHLRAEPPRDLGDHVGPLDRRGVHADLVRTRAQQPVDVLGGAHPAADRERDEHLLGGATHDVVRRLAGAGGRGDVEEGQLVGALGVVHLGHLDRVAGVAQVGEVDALDDPAGVDVQARDDPDGEAAHHPEPGL